MYRIVSNKIRCKFCGDVIQSMSRHHFVRCKCGKCFTDGGTDYLRIGFDGEKPEDAFEDLSTYVNEETGELVAAKDIRPEDIRVSKDDTPESPTPDIPEVTEAAEAEPEKPFEPPEEAKFIKQHLTKAEREAKAMDVWDEE